MTMSSNQQSGRSSRTRLRPQAEINVVPYIDVMLVLLIIFMITAPLLSQGVHVDLPKVQAHALPPKEIPLIISIDENGQYFLNSQTNPQAPLMAQDLVTQVVATLTLAKERQEQRDVYVKGDQHVSYGRVIALMALLQEAGVDNVGLITEPPAPNSLQR